MHIPFNKIYYTGREMDYIKEALESTNISGDGNFNNKVCSLLKDQLNSSNIFTFTNCTHALETAMLLLDIRPGDEVIIPSFTFASTANAVLLRGGTPVFAEVEKKTLTLDIEDVENKITNQTRAIIPVQYGGIGCPMDEIMDLANKYNIYVIEDAAQALGSTYKGKALGTWGHMGCFSFHGTKNYICGEGGALSINMEDEKIINRAEIIRQKGTNRQEFNMGKVNQYTWVDIGSSYAPSDVLMAILYSQLQQIDYIMEKRKKITETYIEKLSKFLVHGKLTSMTNIPEYFNSNYHNFYLRFNNQNHRDYVISQLKSRDIDAYIHFVPLHSSPMGLKLGYKYGDLPITEKIGETLMRIPLYTAMSEEEQDYVIMALYDILEVL